MTTFRLRGPAKARPCGSCGKTNRTHGDVCSACKCAAENVALGVRSCAFCGEEIPRHRKIISPYFSIECSGKVGEIRSAAANAIRKAVIVGSLQKLDGNVLCVDCGKPAQHYDHRDYTKPLDVVPVCRSCNIRRGPANVFAYLESAA